MPKTLTPRDRATIRSAWISLGISIVLLAFKFLAYELTKSTAVLSDAIESIVNVVAAVVAVFVMRAVAEPADEEHPYGHGKLEYFSAAFEGGLIAFAALAIANEAIRSFLHGNAPKQLDVGAYIMVGAAIGNLLLGLHLRSVGRKYKSEALQASSAHVISDVWTTVGVTIGLVIIYLTNLVWVDAAVALLVAAQLGYSGYQIVRKSVGALIDEVEPQSLSELASAFEKHRENWICDIHNIKVIRSGHFHHIDGHLVVPEFWDVAKTHQLSSEFERKVVEDYPFDGEIAFHIDPCERKYCEQCPVEDCPIRAKKRITLKKFTAESITGGPISNGK
jgi:cation diffusion facilitator family transporter